MDLSKLFDKIDRQILMRKYYGGIGGHALSWLKDYLYNRKQYYLTRELANEKSFAVYRRD